MVLGFGSTGTVFSQSIDYKNTKGGSTKMTNSLILKRSDTVLLLVDHQVGLLSGVRDIGTAELSNNVAALAKAAKILGIPVIVTNVGPGDMWGPLIPELAKELPGVNIIQRTAVNAWDDPKVVEAVKATGRKQILVAGISLEVCAALPAMSAYEQGYDTRVVLDASGTFNQAKRQSGIQRLTVAGIPLTDYATASVELLGDNADPKSGEVYGAMNMSFANIVWQLNTAAKASVANK
ncbi:isochorismatase family protein [Polynucleobacter sp. 86C-FISCH]|nr:isochorismatase family protein [Polynucleobacter sp. 86C-FISCH]